MRQLRIGALAGALGLMACSSTNVSNVFETAADGGPDAIATADAAPVEAGADAGSDAAAPEDAAEAGATDGEGGSPDAAPDALVACVSAPAYDTACAAPLTNAYMCPPNTTPPGLVCTGSHLDPSLTCCN